jgi:hypothetical protein
MVPQKIGLNVLYSLPVKRKETYTIMSTTDYNAWPIVEGLGLFVGALLIDYLWSRYRARVKGSRKLLVLPKQTWAPKLPDKPEEPLIDPYKNPYDNIG